MPLHHSNLTVARRLTLAFGAIVFILLAVASATGFTSSRLAEADRWNTHTYRVLGTASGMLENMINMETGARGFIVSGKDNFLEPWNLGRTAFDKSWDEAKRLTADNPTQQKRLDDMKARRTEFEAIVVDLFEMRRDVEAGKVPMAAMVEVFSKGKDKSAMDGFRSLHQQFDKMERDLLVERSAEAESMRAANRATLMVGALLGMLAAIGLGAWITRGLMRELGGEPSQAADAARMIAEGDLATPVPVRAGDTTSLMAAMHAMQVALTQTVASVRNNADSVATASEQIAQGNSDLSSRTEQQAASLEETAATMTELGTTVTNNADNARQANQLARSASDVAQQGGTVVGEVVETMKGINDSSRKIAEIISVIDGIAFQTNILALNAAVEAARAGEQGRGFAVVASEVRSLAQRSADAAKEIKSLITASVERVEQGSALVDKAGATMDEVVASIRRVTDIVGEITSASAEQANGVSQVGEAVTQMDQMTQQNSALVEESAAAAQSLRSQAQALVQAVAVFRLSGDAHDAMGMNATTSPAPNRASHVTRQAFKAPTVKAAGHAPQAQPAAALTSSAGTDDWTSF
ncbi:methyl-accepting chemotaxis protein [Leptothrix discophora]|uniref:Methyl-accepting chemotaxis protein n=1 Tax=Leptothrix discophora TaxID=89 RepID=A0ABT9G848_LEPDI|nr:methyl-accepting chemotaxis protein [Leptothrix discophora]MDP4302654.1 methyl-accepting chemotaxis protein [Leptothrix discophora]